MEVLDEIAAKFSKICNSVWFFQFNLYIWANMVNKGSNFIQSDQIVKQWAVALLCFLPKGIIKVKSQDFANEVLNVDNNYLEKILLVTLNKRAKERENKIYSKSSRVWVDYQKDIKTVTKKKDCYVRR